MTSAAAMIVSRAPRGILIHTWLDEEDALPSPPTIIEDRTIRWERGTDVVFRLTVFDDAEERQDLTGWGLQLRMERTLGDSGAAELVKTVGAGITLLTQTGATTGQADVTFTAAETAALPVGIHWYNVRGTTPTALVVSLIPASQAVLSQEI